MLKKLLRRIKGFFYAIPFAMKAGDELLGTSNKDNTDGSSVHQKVEKDTVYDDLLKGEVTEEVEELRYEMYKTDEEANNYQYVGSGQAIKIEETEEKKKKRRLKFTQENISLDYGVHESLEKANSKKNANKMDFSDRKLFKCIYNNECPLFKLENYFNKVSVNLRKEPITKMYFIDDKTFKKNVPLINKIKKVFDELMEIDPDDIERYNSYLSRCELLSSLKEMSFTTFKATNNVPNGITYTFKGPHFDDIEFNGDYVIMSFKWDYYEGGELLSEKYYSEKADEKFKKKERRNGKIPTAEFKMQ